MVKIYEVGGKVRDSFIGRENKDIDYAMQAGSYEEMRDYILINGGKIYLETPQYQTIQAAIGDTAKIIHKLKPVYNLKSSDESFFERKKKEKAARKV